MANNGTYGITKPAVINPNDVDIFYHYRPSRSTDSADFNEFQKLDSTYLVKQTYTDGVNSNLRLDGMYNLRLPLNLFGVSGIYTIYIKPKEISATILDVSSLAAYPDVKGIVIDTSNIVTEDTTIFNNGGLVGYRVEYNVDSEDDNSELYRIITSSNRCEPIAQNLNDASAKGIRYRLNTSSNLLFCTVTPSSSMSFNSSSTPYIGQAQEKIKLVSTKFNPVCIEVEMTEHDIEDVSTMLENSQVRNLNNGLITTFNNDGDIYHQADFGTNANQETGQYVDFKIKKDKSSIIVSEKDNLEYVKEAL